MNIIDRMGSSHLILMILMFAIFIGIEEHSRMIEMFTSAVAIPILIYGVIAAVKVLKIVKKMGLENYSIYVVGIIISDILAGIIVYLGIR